MLARVLMNGVELGLTLFIAIVINVMLCSIVRGVIKAFKEDSE